MFQLPVAYSLIVILLIGGIEELRLYNAKEEIKEKAALYASCSASLAVANANTATLKAAIDTQNAKIDVMQAEAKARAARAAAAARQALKMPGVEAKSGPASLNEWIRNLYK